MYYYFTPYPSSYLDSWTHTLSHSLVFINTLLKLYLYSYLPSSDNTDEMLHSIGVSYIRNNGNYGIVSIFY